MASCTPPPAAALATSVPLGGDPRCSEEPLKVSVVPVTLNVKFVPHGNVATLDVTAHLQRLDFGIGTGEWGDTSMIGNAVTVNGHLVLRAQP